MGSTQSTWGSSVFLNWSKGNNIMKSFILASCLVLSVIAVTEVHGWYGYYGYYPYYGYYHGGKLLAPPSIANIDYGKTGIKYLDARKKRSVGPLIPFSTVKMEDIDYGKTKIAYPESRRKRSVKVIHPAPISMANIDYGKTKITYSKKKAYCNQFSFCCLI